MLDEGRTWAPFAFPVSEGVTGAEVLDKWYFGFTSPFGD